MRSVPAAMTWEMFSNGRWSFLGAILAAHAVPALLLTALRNEGGFDPHEESSIVIHVVVMLMNGTTIAATIMSAQRHPSRLYAFPISNATLVAWQMLPAMVTLFVESVLSTMTLNAVYGLGWPLWGPALFLACALAAVQGMMWLTEKSAWLILALTVVGGLIGTWFMSRHGIVFGRPAHLWSEVTATEILTMLAFTILSYGVAVVGIGRDRCGEALRTEALRAWIERLLDPAPAFGQPFPTPQAAQFWAEWRQKGAMPWLFGFVLTIAFGAWVLFNRNPGFLLEGCLTTGYFLPIIGFVMGMVIGTVGPADGKFEMGQFLATRPITNSDLSRNLLKTTALNVAGAWLVWCLAATAAALVLWAANSLPVRVLPAEMQWWHIPAVLIGTWLTTALMACLILCGHQRFLGAAFFGGFAVIILGNIFGKWGLSEAQRPWFYQTVLIVTGIAFLAGTVWAFVKARRRVMIRSQTVSIAAVGWVIFAGLAAVDLLLYRDLGIPSALFVAGIGALAVAPLALTPLALAWNRHR